MPTSRDKPHGASAPQPAAHAVFCNPLLLVLILERVYHGAESLRAVDRAMRRAANGVMTTARLSQRDLLHPTPELLDTFPAARQLECQFTGGGSKLPSEALAGLSIDRITAACPRFISKLTVLKILGYQINDDVLPVLLQLLQLPPR
jgi:hypothetical protein